MATIHRVIVEVDDPARAEELHRALGVEEHLEARAAAAAGTGFRGFTVSLVAAQPADVRLLLERAVAAGAAVVQEPKKSLWGYGGSFRDADGGLWTLASSSKKDKGEATGRVDELVLQIGVHDVAASKKFYERQGFTVAKSYGRKYAELDTGAVTLALAPRPSLAKTAGVPEDGDGSHQVAIRSDAGTFTDPDGFVWESATPS